MSRNQNDLNKKVAETLNSLDNWERPNSNPYFFTKLNERIQADKEEKQSGFFSTWLQPALFTLLVFFNVYTVYNFTYEQNTEETEISAYIDLFQSESETNSEDYLSFDQ